MSRPVCVPVRITHEFLRGFGAVRRRMELEEIAIEYSASDLGLKFEIKRIEFKRLPEGVFDGEIIRRIESELTPEQMITVKFLEERALETGFGIEFEEEKCLPERPCLSLQLEPFKDFNDLLESSFKDIKALPPPSKDSIPVSELFEFERKETV